MSYDFGPYRSALSADWYADDDLLRRLLARFAPNADLGRIEAFGPLTAGPLAALAEESARPENAPALRHRTPFGDRIDDVLLPPSTSEALALAHGDQGLGAVRGDPFVHYAMIYLLAQNGEAGVACSLACTDGLVRALQALGDKAVHRHALQQVLGSTAARFAHGAQFVTEIQGGSDVRANETRAIADGENGYRLYGEKWFCSNINADWFLVTARPGEPSHAASDDEDGEDPRNSTVGLFLVPAWAHEAGGAEGNRNGYRIERLKDKLGTRELATAEVTFEGARAWAVGPVQAGLANLLRHVLVPSRFACALFAAGALRRAERIVQEYSAFREAFGRPIRDYRLVGRTLGRISDARARTLGCTFELLRLWETADAGDLDFRILLSLAKPVLTYQGTSLLHEAMMLLAGNGIEERFSPLPRLFRDSVIMETWEGPHNVLYTQALRDLVRFGTDPHEFVSRLAGPGRRDLGDTLAAAMEAGAAGDDDAVLMLADAAPDMVAAVGQNVVEDLVHRP